MADWYLLKKEEKEIYFPKDKIKNFNLFEASFKQKGFQIIYLQNINELFKSLSIEEDIIKEKQENPFSENMELILENISSSRSKDFFNSLQFSIIPFISILNKMNIGFCICDHEHYILLNKNFLETIQYNREEVKEIPPGDIVFERDRRDIEKKMEQSKVQNIKNREFEFDLNIITRNKAFRYLKYYTFEIEIEGKCFFVNYIFNQEEFQYDSQSTWAMNRLIVSELNNIFINQIRMNTLNVMPYEQEGIHVNGRSVPCNEALTFNITQRELEILKQVYKGYSNKEIAKKLYISVRTVEYHRSNLLQKTFSKNAVDLIRFAVEHGLISIQ